MEDGLALVLSASQIQLWLDCKRKWAFRYISKIETPPHPSAVLGSDTHDNQLAPYFTEQRPFDFTRPSGYIAASILGFLPDPKTPGLVSEQFFVMPSPTGRFSYRGYIDLWLPQGGLPKWEATIAEVDNTCTVTDFKTTSDLKWAKSPETLKTDIQANLYATWAMYSTGSRVVNLDWLYMQTRGAKKAKRVHLQVDGDHVYKQFKRIDEIGQEIIHAYDTVGDPLELPPTAEMCEAFGGCPYRSNCNLAPDQIIDSLAAKARQQKDTTDMTTTADLLASLKAKRSSPASTGPVNPPEAALPPAPPVGAVTDTETEKPKRGRKTKAAETPAEAVAAVKAPVTPDEVFPQAASTNYVIDGRALVQLAIGRAQDLIKQESDLDKVTRFLHFFGKAA